MNGQIECFNATMDAKIASFSNQSRSNLDDQLRFLTFNYNIAIHSTTKIIPFELMYGPSPVVPCDSQNPIVSFQSYFQYAPKLNQYISSLADTARRNIVLTQQSSKSRYDTHRSDPSYNVYGIVLIRNLHRRHKLEVLYEGPYRVIKRINHGTYVVKQIRLHHVVR